MTKTIMLAAPSSGSGKTSIAMGMIRALLNKDKKVVPIKIGPDYIDSGWHAMAATTPCWNLDPWAMSATTQDAVMTAAQNNSDWCIIEGVMGLYDGAFDGRCSSYDVARKYDLPIVLVVDASHQADSIAALVGGFHHFRGNAGIAGIILNRVGSSRHEALLRRALEPLQIPVIACLPQFADASIGSRHLGLFQAGEGQNDRNTVESLAKVVDERIDWAMLEEVACSPKVSATPLPPPPYFAEYGSIAIARDAAFSFIYQHHIAAWRQGGAEVQFFSPLAGDRVPVADAIFLPGGYPELHLTALSQSPTLASLRHTAQEGCAIYGECGGYMVLGEAIIDKQGHAFAMAGILPQTTSMQQPKRTLGYRLISATQATPFNATAFRGHEFHYSQARNSQKNLFYCRGVSETKEQPLGDWRANVFGSYLHIVDSAPSDTP